MCALFMFVYLNVSLLKSRSCEYLSSFGVANSVTVFRVVLIPSIAVFLFHDMVLVGMILYILGASLDIVDGATARLLKQESMLGVMLDPVGDIATTSVAFFFLWRVKLVPTWLFTLLVLRYAQFFIGLALMALLKATPKLKATLAGKAAAVVQGVVISIFLLDYSFPSIDVPHFVVSFEYYVLAFTFVWVIISQSVIGYRALKLRATH